MGTGSLTWKRDIVYVGTKEIAEVDATGTEITFVDHLGSPRFAWRGGTTPVIKQKFLPFGEQLTDPTTAKSFAKGFTNHEQTDPSGLVYMQARFYAPWYGRFLSPDPARDQHFEQTQSWNIYSYVQNNPTMLVDPDGMKIDWGRWVNRGLGVLRVVGGLAEMSAGAALTAGTAGVGSVPGALVALHGADAGAAGLKQIWTGENESTLTSRAIQRAGVHKDTADAIDAGISLGSTAAGSRALASRASQTATTAETQASGAPKSLGAGGRKVYEASPKHPVGISPRPGVSPGPVNGQAALDVSLGIGPNTATRVGVDYKAGQFVVFNETHTGTGIFHGHVRSWGELSNQMRSVLYKAGMASRKGEIIVGGK